MKTLLFKPFEKYSEQKLLIVGIIGTLTGAFLTYLFNCKFSRALKIIPIDDASIGQSVINSIVIVVCLTLFLFIVAKYIYKKTRLIDIFVTAMVAYIPLYILTLLNINNNLKVLTEDAIKHASLELANQVPLNIHIPLLLVRLLNFAILAWFITLLYNGFKTAANAKGTKAIVVFAIALLLADVVSKIVIHLLN